MVRRSFTLTELLVVIAIIAILAVIAVPQYNKYRANSMYSVLEKNLKASVLWAENVVADSSKFPNGICDASNIASSGTFKCAYDATNDNITSSSTGDLTIEIPLKVTFTRNNTNQNCGVVKVECPINRCAGLKNSQKNGNALICQDTCANPSLIKTDNNIHGVVNGGCP